MLNIPQPWGCRAGVLRGPGLLSSGRKQSQSLTALHWMPHLQKCEGLKEQGKCRTSVLPRTLLFISTLDDSPGRPDFYMSFFTGEVVKRGKLSSITGNCRKSYII